MFRRNIAGGIVIKQFELEDAAPVFEVDTKQMRHP